MHLFPAIVWLAAGVQVGPRVDGACAWLGRLSYPLYVLHHPIVRIVFDAAQKLHLSNGPMIAATSVALSIILAWAVMIADENVRRWLSARLLGIFPKPRAVMAA
jgi:peptidoglycan/LPS O-acetylase OafA/YrhL